MIPYHGYEAPALVHAHHTAHHPVYAGNNNSVAEAEVPKYARWEKEMEQEHNQRVFLADNCGQRHYRVKTWQQICQQWLISNRF